jgi:hypothetical protein
MYIGSEIYKSNTDVCSKINIIVLILFYEARSEVNIANAMSRIHGH